MENQETVKTSDGHVDTNIDNELPDAPPLTMVKETFGGLIIM